MPFSFRTQLLSPQLTSVSGGRPWWADYVDLGIGILGGVLNKRGGGGGIQPAGLLPSMASGYGTPTTVATIGTEIVKYGGIIVGNVIRISRRAWARVPGWVKQAAQVLGLTVAFEGAADVLGFGNGNGEMPHRRRRGISYAQLRGFHRVTSLLRKVGMQPRGLCAPRRRRVCK